LLVHYCTGAGQLLKGRIGLEGNDMLGQSNTSIDGPIWMHVHDEFVRDSLSLFGLLDHLNSLQKASWNQS
jgi:hypothetical protein